MLEKKIASARSSGYTDAQIVDYLKNDPDIGSQIQTALSSNYQPTQILDYLSPDKGYGSALQFGTGQAIEGVGKSVKQVGQGFESDTTDKVGRFVEQAGSSIKPRNYRSGIEEFLRPNKDEEGLGGYGWAGLPRSIVESAPVLAAALATRSPTVAAGLFGATSYGENVEQTMRNNNRDPAKDKATGGELLQGGLTTAAEAALGGYGVGKVAGPMRGGIGQGLKQFGKGIGIEGAVGAGQDLIGQVGTSLGTDKGVSVDPNQVLASGLTNAGTAGLVRSPALARNALSNLQLAGVDNANNQASYAANLIRRVVDDHPTLDITSTKDSGQIVQEALKFNNGRINDALKAVKDDLISRNLQDAATQLDGLRENADTLSLIKNAKTKTGAAVGPEAIKRIEELVGNTANGQMLVDALRAQSALKTVNGQMRKVGDNYIGGLASKMPLLEKLASVKAMTALGAGGTALGYAMSNVPFASAATAAVTAHPMAALAAASAIPLAYAGVRGVDALTGSRNPLDRFMTRFEDPSLGTTRESTAPSKQMLQEQAQANMMAERDRVLAERQAARDAALAEREAAREEALRDRDAIQQGRQNTANDERFAKQATQLVDLQRQIDKAQGIARDEAEYNRIAEMRGDLGEYITMAKQELSRVRNAPKPVDDSVQRGQQYATQEKQLAKQAQVAAEALRKLDAAKGLAPNEENYATVQSIRDPEFLSSVKAQIDGELKALGKGRTKPSGPKEPPANGDLQIRPDGSVDMTIVPETKPKAASKEAKTKDTKTEDVPNAEVIKQRAQNFLRFEAQITGKFPDTGPAIVDKLLSLNGSVNHGKPGLEAIKQLPKEFGEAGEYAKNWWLGKGKIENSRFGRMFFSRKLNKVIMTPKDAEKSRGF